jgi:hypothetical protein
MERTVWGQVVDEVAVGLLRQGHRLRPLLDHQFFFAEANTCYVLAGSFTGFLIRTFGLDAYRRFYRGQVQIRRFDERFSKHFGLTLEEVEEQWRKELLDLYEEWWVCRFK